MDILTAASVCALFVAGPHSCVASARVSSPAVAQWQPLIADAAHRFGIPEDWIRGVMRLESGGHTMLDGVPVTSSAGAMGLMQLMPGTYADMRARYDLGADAYDPHDNIFAGTAYMHEMFVRYGYPNLFAAYQAGPARLEQFLSTAKPLPKSTVDYMNLLVSGTGNELTAHEKPASRPPKSARDPLFFVRGEDEISSSAPAISAQQPNGLFVPLHKDTP
ncbi:MAG TPA: lytic transglycosylase domain-containing protein [Rhizomicrobium sp.]